MGVNFSDSKGHSEKHHPFPSFLSPQLLLLWSSSLIPFASGDML